MTIPIGVPVPVQRLLAVAALADGVSLDEYVVRILTERAEEIRTLEARAEYAVMLLESRARLGRPVGIKKPQQLPEGGPTTPRPTDRKARQ
jgi:hypothetical protein